MVVGCGSHWPGLGERLVARDGRRGQGEVGQGEVPLFFIDSRTAIQQRCGTGWATASSAVCATVASGRPCGSTRAPTVRTTSAPRTAKTCCCGPTTSTRMMRTPTSTRTRGHRRRVQIPASRRAVLAALPLRNVCARAHVWHVRVRKHH